MLAHFRLKLLVAAVGMATASVATAANTQVLRGQPLAVPASSLATHLNLGQNMTLQTRNATAVANGRKVVRQQQMFRGVPVYGRSIAVVQDAQGTALRASGEVVQEAQLGLTSVAPRLTPAKVLAVLRGQAQTLLVAGAKIDNPKSELFVYPQDSGPARLVYRVSYFVDDPANPSRPSAIIDANTGEVIKSWEGLTHASANGPGGNTKTGQYHYGTDYAALDVTQSGSTCTLKNANVTTYNLKRATSGSGTLVSFICPTSNTDAVNGAYSPVNDAHHFGGVVHDMYQSYIGAPPLSFSLVMKVHYGNNYENAFWNGSVMTFGDGATTFYPLVSLDVTSHEISHGYTEQNSGLEYTGQSGGMNEAYSDIAGEAAEYFDRGTVDYLVGADITKTRTALRYMCTPTQDGGSIDHASNYYSGIDVHYSSGVYNKSFCLLAKTGGWDVKKAFQVYALANKSYWAPNSTFNAGACGVESAAQDLGYNVADVVAAFNGVGVTCPSGPGPGPGPAGDLQNGVALTGQSGSASQELSYTVVIPAGATNLVIASSGGTGDADLYTRFGVAPTTSSYDCRPYKAGNNESCTVAAPQAGTYHVKLRGYSAFSGVSVKASWTTASTPPPPTGNVLQNGVPVSGLSAATGYAQLYTIVVPSGARNLNLAISGGSGDADLYVRFGSAPTTTTYDCRPYKAGNSESCAITVPQAGTYHVAVNAYKGYSNVTLKGSFTP